MSWLYRTLIRPALFRHEAERIHDLTLRGLGWVARHDLVCEACAACLGAAPLEVEAFGLTFPNPVGLAAGMDKHASAVPAWAALGFGFSELGGVTWHAQPGNPPPRVFRIIGDRAIINRMGFNNDGAAAVAERLAAWRAAVRWPRHPVGINLGKSKITPLEQAARDYADSFRVLWPHADFFVVNVSSPNTPNLRQLQDKAALGEILSALDEVNTAQAQAAPLARSLSLPPGGVAGAPAASSSSPARVAGPKPILVKVAPDLSFEALDEIVELVVPHRLAGLVATNTTLARPDGPPGAVSPLYAEAGGLSGLPLRARSTEVIRHLHRQTGGRLPIIGVGGVFSAADAWEKITNGATLIQVYTGLVYEGPTLARELVAGLRQRLEAEGLDRLQDAVGLALKSASSASAPPARSV
jgi:dihydroorotate dehydrogenase